MTGAAACVEAEPGDWKAHASAVLRKHLDSLIGRDGNVVALKGKAADALSAWSFEMLHAATANTRYRSAALHIADRIVASMKRMPAGVLAIKEKAKPGETVMGGGPPALGWYASAIGHIYRRAGGHDAELTYAGRVLDRFPWNPQGWWAATVDVTDGHSPMPMDKPTPVNKNCGMALACAVLSEALKKSDASLAARLREKTVTCLERQIYPAQERNGFWHYGLTGNDPKSKDVLGYFMLSTELLIGLERMAPSFRSDALRGAITRATGFAEAEIAAPARYDFAAEPKRGYMLCVLLARGGFKAAFAKNIGTALRHFPVGNRGQDGAHCAHDLALALAVAS